MKSLTITREVTYTIREARAPGRPDRRFKSGYDRFATVYTVVLQIDNDWHPLSVPWPTLAEAEQSLARILAGLGIEEDTKNSSPV
jgi:hypothetical protein